MLSSGRDHVIPPNPQHVKKVMKYKGEAGNTSLFSFSKLEPPLALKVEVSCLMCDAGKANYKCGEE